MNSISGIMQFSVAGYLRREMSTNAEPVVCALTSLRGNLIPEICHRAGLTSLYGK